MKKILVVDDEKKIVEIVKAYLEKEGYKVMAAYDGKSALESARRDLPDLIILDLMLPEVSGWDVCRELRRESDVPVIMLTARDDITDKVIGLELGADDYITKPFDPKEVISRVRAVLRRSEGKVVSGTALQVGDITVDVDRRLVRRADQPVELTPIEFDLLKMMAGSPGRVYSRMQLLDGVKGDAYEGYERTVDSHIKNLRKKLEPDPEHPRYIKTVYGVGYKLEEQRSA
ncbi:MAG: response regulator transcription factor [Dehalococcoidales bacterium]|nr:response regulator transcription factor [Dehalococcoidales bacterium]